MRGTWRVLGSPPRTERRKTQVRWAPGGQGSPGRNWKHKGRDQTCSEVTKGLWKQEGRADSREK